MDVPAPEGFERWAAVHTECLQRDGGRPPKAQERRAAGPVVPNSEVHRPLAAEQCTRGEQPSV